MSERVTNLKNNGFSWNKLRNSRVTSKDCEPDYSLTGTESIEGIAAYIMECKVPGIGKKLSHDIARRYGKYTFDYLCDPDYKQIAYDIDGIGERKALALHTAFNAKFGPEVARRKREEEERKRAVTMFWGELGLTGWMRDRIENHFGKDAVSELRKDPYLLTEIDGIGFKRADEIAAKFGITGDDPRRIRAGIRYTLEDIAKVEGHCCLPREVLTAKAAHKNVLDVASNKVQDVIDSEIKEGHLILDGMVYLPDVYEAECEVADRLQYLNEDNKRLTKYEVTQIATGVGYHWDSGFAVYNQKQREAIALALRHHMMILTGGPGTGKTTTLKGMLEAFKTLRLRCVLCAPTGRAAKRMSEATKQPAKTIHRLLEYQQGQFTRNEDNPIDEDVIICDESSMIDLMLMRSLLRATVNGHRLILIGDNDQLPSVGAGRVLGDLIDSGAIPTVRLTEIYRQQEGSYIISNAHNIIHGALPIVQGATDFFFLPAQTEDEAQDLVVSLVSDRLPKAYPKSEIQVICPMRKDGIKTGCNELNQRLQQALNPNGWPLPIGEGRIRRGDRVMQMKNNYALDVFNGDVGIADGIGRREQTEWDGFRYGKKETTVLNVRYPDRKDKVGYNDESVHDLDLCYATTIHKSQGSEYDTVVIVIMPSAYIMLQRNLLYTAVTRAKKRCIIVGDWESVKTAIAAWRTKPRYTRLKERIKL